MTDKPKREMPQRGGSYIRGKDGSLKRNEPVKLEAAGDEPIVGARRHGRPKARPGIQPEASSGEAATGKE